MIIRPCAASITALSEWANLSRRSTDLERALAEAVAARTESEEEAKGLLVEVLQQTQKLIVFLTELEVVETVDIETLIPVVLTEPEKRAEMNKVQKVKCIESISFSSFNPVPPYRKMVGDIFYLTIKTLDTGEHGITCCINGFYKNDNIEKS